MAALDAGHARVARAREVLEADRAVALGRVGQAAREVRVAVDLDRQAHAAARAVPVRAAGAGAAADAAHAAAVAVVDPVRVELAEELALQARVRAERDAARGASRGGRLREAARRAAHARDRRAVHRAARARRRVPVVAAVAPPPALAARALELAHVRVVLAAVRARALGRRLDAVGARHLFRQKEAGTHHHLEPAMMDAPNPPRNDGARS